MRELRLDHLEIDEIWTFVGVKQAHIRYGCSDAVIGDQYLFVAFDQTTKLVATWAIGKRTAEVTERFMLDLASRVVHSREERPQISTDGFAAYPGAVDLAFAREADFGVLIKSYGEGEQPGRYGPPDSETEAWRRLWWRSQLLLQRDEFVAAWGADALCVPGWKRAAWTAPLADILMLPKGVLPNYERHQRCLGGSQENLERDLEKGLI